MHLFCILLCFLMIFKFSTSIGEDYSKGGKITGGYEARPHSNPYIVSLQSRFLWRRYRLCSGSILSERWILSAGHCATDTWAKWFAMDAIVGAHNLAKVSSSQVYPISNRIPHPMYRGGVGPYDIAMMRTAHKMVYSRTVQPINLPASSPKFSKDEKLLITGWGALQSTLFITEIPNKLQEVKVNYLPYNDCYWAVDRIKDIYEANPLKRIANICTGPISGGIAGCKGDSGGPLVQYVAYSNGEGTTLMETTTKEETTTTASLTTTGSTASPTLMTTNKPSTTTTTQSTTATTSAPTTPAAATTPAASTTVAATITTSDATTTVEITTTRATTVVETTTAGTITEKTTTEVPATEASTSEPVYESRRRFLYNYSTSNTRYGNNNRRKINNLRAIRNDMMPTVVGVISWGVVPCGDRGAPTVYSNVTNYMDFINKYLHSY